MRTYGVEIEGFTSVDLIGYSHAGWFFTHDNSLENECEACDGDGKNEKECEECKGERYVDCPDCDGTNERETDCEDCNGEDEDCDVCDGDGWYWEECSECDDDGEIECTDCLGDGYSDEECEECEGTGSGNKLGHEMEAVSGILDEGDYMPIFRIYNYLERYDWRSNEDCGIHIHVGAEDLSAPEISRLFILANIFEPVLYGAMPEFRRSWAKPTRKNMIKRLMELGGDITMQELANAYYEKRVDLDGEFNKYNSKRYRGLNLHSYFVRETMEFRYFDSTEDSHKLVEWIAFCIRMVDFATHTTFEQLEVLASAFKEEDSYYNYVHDSSDVLGVRLDAFELSSLKNFEKSIKNIAFEENYVGLGSRVG